MLQQSPLQYLASGRPRPPHSCTEQQVVEALQKLLLSRPKGGLLDPDLLDARAMSERVLALLATHDPHGYANQTWDEVALAELSRRLQDGEPCEALAQWFGERLAAHEGSDALLVPCYPNVVTRFHDQLVSLLTSDSERWAYRAAQLLWTVDQRIDITAALQNRHGLVREWAVELVVAGEVEVPVAQLLPMLADSEEDVREELARHFGAIVSKEAVPGLIGLLRDPVDSVRTAAADALTRIRFYHEQQAHWDRVLKGLDASPASACEKLLLQAKPGQPAAQRLLAIESLGTLGVPEALPFLIDWTTDPDEAVAKAARAAITAIHLNPRR
ncbi:MAG: HEAT repeat domain-containing protein [Planctomycetota bacterium]